MSTNSEPVPDQGQVEALIAFAEKHPDLDLSSVGLQLRLRTEEFDRLARAMFGEYVPVKVIAAKLGVNYTHFSSIRTGNRRPGLGFVAAVKTLMPNVPVEQLFEVVDGKERAA